MTHLYIAGGMSGIVDHNFPAFERARRTLRGAGYTVTCPAELGQVKEWDWADYLKRDLVALMACDGIALLPNWAMSRGARLEVHVAEELGLVVQSVDCWLEDAW